MRTFVFVTIWLHIILYQEVFNSFGVTSSINLSFTHHHLIKIKLYKNVYQFWGGFPPVTFDQCFRVEIFREQWQILMTHTPCDQLSLN